MSNSITSVAACPKVPTAPATTPAPGTGSTEVKTDSLTNFMCQDILQMVEIVDHVLEPESMEACRVLLPIIS